MIKVENKANVLEAMIELVTQLVDQEILTPLSVNGSVDGTIDESFRYGAFEFTGDVLSETQKVRFRFDITELTCSVFVGTDISIDESGSVISKVVNEQNGLVTGQMFASGGDLPWYSYTVVENPEEAETQGQLFTAIASITDHGIGICLYEQNAVIDGIGFSWFVVQRPVNEDGSVYVEDRAPVVCLFGATPDESNQTNVNFCVVREFDVNTPTEFLDASVNHEERVAVINSMEQVAIAPSRRACIFFPSGFNTQRYFYALELDMFAYTSADVISMSSTVPDDRYGTVRNYLALNSNKKLNQGMRFLFYIGES